MGQILCLQGSRLTKHLPQQEGSSGRGSHPTLALFLFSVTNLNFLSSWPTLLAFYSLSKIFVSRDL